MKTRTFELLILVFAVVLMSGCAGMQARSSSAKSFVIIGESNATGAEAAQELQLAINRSQTVGCRAKSVGGYGAAGEGLILGLAALIQCPEGVHIIPTGFPYNAKTGVAIPVDPSAVLPPPLAPNP